MTQRMTDMIANVMPMAPVNPGAFSGMQAPRPMPPQADQMMQNMPMANLDPTSQESMMNYLMEKVEQIRQRTGAQGQEGMGALDALMNIDFNSIYVS